MERDLIAFRTAAAAYRANVDALRTLRADHEAAWRANGWRQRYDHYFERRGTAPSGRDPDAWVREIAPEAAVAMAEIEAASATYFEKRQGYLDAAVPLLRSALQTLAAAFSPELDERAAAEPGRNLQEILDEIYEEASDVRRTELDGKRLDFDPDGPFTQGVLAPVADRLGVERRGRNWAMATIEAGSAPQPRL